MKVETSQEKLVRYQKEHEILGMDEKQNITMEKLDELNKELTTAESERMDKESLLSPGRVRGPGCHRRPARVRSKIHGAQSASALLDALRGKQADLKIQVADLNTQFGPSYPKLNQLNNQLKEIDAQIQAEMKKLAARFAASIPPPCSAKTCCATRSRSRSRKPTSLTKARSSTTLLKRDVETNRQLYEGLLQKTEGSGRLGGLEIQQFSHRRQRPAPDRPDRAEHSPQSDVRRRPRLGVWGRTGLPAGRLDNTVRTTEQAQTISGWRRWA